MLDVVEQQIKTNERDAGTLSDELHSRWRPQAALPHHQGAFAVRSPELQQLFARHTSGAEVLVLENVQGEAFSFMRRYVLFLADKLRVQPLCHAMKQFTLPIDNTNALMAVLAQMHRLRFHDFCDHIIMSRVVWAK